MTSALTRRAALRLGAISGLVPGLLSDGLKKHVPALVPMQPETPFMPSKIHDLLANRLLYPQLVADPETGISLDPSISCLKSMKPWAKIHIQLIRSEERKSLFEKLAKTLRL